MLAPLATNVWVCPGQILPFATFIVGFGNTLMVAYAVSAQKLFFPITVAVAVGPAPGAAVAATIEAVVELRFKFAPGKRLYVRAPEALKVTVAGDPLVPWAHMVGLVTPTFTVGVVAKVTAC